MDLLDSYEISSVAFRPVGSVDMVIRIGDN